METRKRADQDLSEMEHFGTDDQDWSQCQERIALVIDDREQGRSLLAALGALRVFVIERRRMPLGDFLVDGALLVERKTLADLVASIEDGRLFAQALRLVQSIRPTVLILEGTAGDLAASRMSWEAIQGALINVSWIIGLPVLRTRTPEETARTMLFAARQIRRVASGALPRRGRRPRGKSAVQSFLLQGLPGVGAARARSLLQRFGSVEAAVCADAAELTEVAGIGTKTAGRIRWAVEESALVYKAAPARTLAPGDERI